MFLEAGSINVYVQICWLNVKQTEAIGNEAAAMIVYLQ